MIIVLPLRPLSLARFLTWSKFKKYWNFSSWFEEVEEELSSSRSLRGGDYFCLLYSLVLLASFSWVQIDTTTTKPFTIASIYEAASLAMINVKLSRNTRGSLLWMSTEATPITTSSAEFIFHRAAAGIDDMKLSLQSIWRVVIRDL